MRDPSFHSITVKWNKGWRAGYSNDCTHFAFGVGKITAYITRTGCGRVATGTGTVEFSHLPKTLLVQGFFCPEICGPL